MNTCSYIVDDFIGPCGRDAVTYNRCATHQLLDQKEERGANTMTCMSCNGVGWLYKSLRRCPACSGTGVTPVQPAKQKTKWVNNLQNSWLQDGWTEVVDHPTQPSDEQKVNPEWLHDYTDPFLQALLSDAYQRGYEAGKGEKDE